MALAHGLLDQQFWCWGRDLGHPDGDALQRFGLVLDRAPGNPLVRRYRGAAGPGVEVVLWGFGVVWQGPSGGLAVWRDDARPRLTPAHVDLAAMEGARSLFAHPRPHGVVARRRALLLAAAGMRWMADYERWALATLGLAHRRAAVASWSRPVCEAVDGPETWRRLAAMAESSSRTPSASGIRGR